MIPSLYIFDYPLFAITVISAIIYVILLSKIMDGWDDTEEWETPKDHIPKYKISVVITARNEEKYIGRCLTSILNSDFPNQLFEIIVINDHSTDNTVDVVKKISNDQITLLNLTEQNGKKFALEKGIAIAKGELIVCTDADCEVPQKWLSTIESFYANFKPNAIAAPIAYHHNRSLVQRFQFLDGLNNMCVTANGIRRKSYFMANGANFTFSKKAFNEVGGYQEKDQYASGDDMFMVQAIAAINPQKVKFLKSKSAIVKTNPEESLNDLKRQRTRWATKSKAYNGKGIIMIQGFVFYFVVLILFNLVFGLFGNGLSFFGFLFALFIKWTMDFLYLNKLTDFFGKTKALESFFSASIGFIIYILFTGWKALFPTKYQWKGRETS